MNVASNVGSWKWILLACTTAMSTVLLASSSRACLWTYGTDHHGHPTQAAEGSADGYIARLTTHGHSRKHWESERDRLRVKVDQGAGYQEQNDYAVALIHLGDYDRALAILEDIEKKHPNQYATAANIGTLHELRGDNEKAIWWIKEGIYRNNESHFGSEWVHVKILEAKVALAKDPNWLKTNPVLGMTFGTELVPERPASTPSRIRGGRELELKEVRQAIEYQLTERLQFVSAPDAVVGDLLADLGDINALDLSVEYAIPVYELALKYGTPREEVVRLRKSHFEKLVSKNLISGINLNDLLTTIAIASIVGFLLLLCLIVVGIRRWQRRRRPAASFSPTR